MDQSFLIRSKLAKQNKTKGLQDFKRAKSHSRGQTFIWMDNKCPGRKEKGKEDFRA